MAVAAGDRSATSRTMRVSTTGTPYAASTSLASGSVRMLRPSASALVTMARAAGGSARNASGIDAGTSVSSACLS